MVVRALPQEAIDRFTMGGRIPLHISPIDSAVPLVHFDQKAIDRAMQETALFELGHYGGVDTWVYLALERYPITGQTVAVIGAADQGFGPWYEAICLNHGAKPLTIEYNRVIYDDTRFTAFKPDEVLAALGMGFKFDAILCVSSVEHDGLTRYGDPLNPDGDLEAMRKFRYYLKRDGLLYLTVPVGHDAVMYNAHRIYGSIRLPLLHKDWTVVDTFGYCADVLDRITMGGWEGRIDGKLIHPNYPAYEPLFVLRNDRPLGRLAVSDFPVPSGVRYDR
jgi:hypothetical protein